MLASECHHFAQLIGQHTFRDALQIGQRVAMNVLVQILFRPQLLAQFLNDGSAAREQIGTNEIQLDAQRLQFGHFVDVLIDTGI